MVTVYFINRINGITDGHWVGTKKTPVFYFSQRFTKWYSDLGYTLMDDKSVTCLAFLYNGFVYILTYTSNGSVTVLEMSINDSRRNDLKDHFEYSSMFNCTQSIRYIMDSHIRNFLSNRYPDHSISGLKIKFA